MDWVPCAIGLGSNLGNSREILESSLHTLSQVDGISLVAKSRWYRTRPFGPPQPDYLNGCALLRVRLSPSDLLATLLAIEAKFGRVRLGKNQPRTIDLDLLLFGDQVVNGPDLQVPHPRMNDRAFVLVPLSEIIPHWREPITGKTILELVDEVDSSQVIGIDV